MRIDVKVYMHLNCYCASTVQTLVSCTPWALVDSETLGSWHFSVRSMRAQRFCMNHIQQCFARVIPVTVCWPTFARRCDRMIQYPGILLTYAHACVAGTRGELSVQGTRVSALSTAGAARPSRQASEKRMSAPQRDVSTLWQECRL